MVHPRSSQAKPKHKRRTDNTQRLHHIRRVLLLHLDPNTLLPNLLSRHCRVHVPHHPQNTQPPQSPPLLSTVLGVGNKVSPPINPRVGTHNPCHSDPHLVQRSQHCFHALAIDLSPTNNHHRLVLALKRHLVLYRIFSIHDIHSLLVAFTRARERETSGRRCLRRKGKERDRNTRSGGSLRRW